MTTRLPRHWTGLQFDPLERRRTPSTMGVADVASAATAGGVLTDSIPTRPANGSVLSLSDSPTVLSLHVGPTLAAQWSKKLVSLDRIDSNHSATSLHGSSVSIDNVSGDVTITLDAPLEAGRYAFILQGGSLSDRFSNGRWDGSRDQVIAEFQVKASGAFDEATDLGVLGSAPLSTTGTLANVDGSQNVYHLQLTDSQPLWQVTLQVDAGRIGSNLVADLAVYDHAGNLVTDVQNGRFQPLDTPGAPLNAANDPYLFIGLAPGDYYVVVSKDAGQPGGSYRLGVAADPPNPLATVTSFNVDHVGGTATGFTIAFSAPLDPNTVWYDSVQLVDASGKSYDLQLTRADYGLQRIGYNFTTPVPAGDYTVIAAGGRPLADLVGRTPVTNGLPAGTLAHFTLSVAKAPTTKPAPISSKPLGGGVISLRAGSSVDVPIVVDQNALLTLRALARSGSLRIEVIGADGVDLVTSGARSVEQPLHLAPGAYTVRLTAVGRTYLAGSWSLVDDAKHDSPVADAVGPAGVLAIRLGVDRSAPSPSPISSPSSTTTPAFNPFGATTGGSLEMGPSPWAIGSSASSTLVGRPEANGDGVASVGPTVPEGVTAVAWAAPGSASITGQFIATNSQADDGANRGPAGATEGQATTPPVDDDAVARVETRTDVASPDADDAALLQADRVFAALQGGFRWLFDGLGDSPEPSPAGESAMAAASADDVGPSNGKVERSSLDLPVGVLFVTASTVHLRRAALRWWRRHQATVTTSTAAQSSTTTGRPLFRGPHGLTPVQHRDRVHAPRHG